MKYTEDEVNNIIKDYKLGMSPKEIGEKYHRSPKSIDDKLRRMGIAKRGTKIYEFTQDDMEFLKNEYPKRNWNVIIQRFPNVPRSKIYKTMSDNSVSMDSYFWSEHDKMILKQYYNTVSVQEIQSMLEKQYSARLIQNQAKKLGLTESREWTDEELNILYENYENMVGTEIQELIPRKSVNAIYIKARQLGLQSGYVHQFYYTDEEKNFIIANWETMSDEEIGNCLGKDARSIMDQRHKLGLYYPVLDRKYYDIADYIRHNNVDWKRRSAKCCNYQCVFTGDSNFEIHHKYSFNLILKEAMRDDRWINKDIIDYDEFELKFILSIFNEYQDKYPLGICVSKSIHKLFHLIYGNRYNTIEQWNEFEKNYKNGLYKHQ